MNITFNFNIIADVTDHHVPHYTDQTYSQITSNYKDIVFYWSTFKPLKEYRDICFTEILYRML